MGLPSTLDPLLFMPSGDDLTTNASEFADGTTSMTSTTLHDDTLSDHTQRQLSDGIADDYSRTATTLDRGRVNESLHSKLVSPTSCGELEMRDLLIPKSRIRETAPSFGDSPSPEMRTAVSWLDSRATASPLIQTAAHQPIAAATIFSRSAAPLSFSELDQFLSGLPAPSFPKFSKSCPTQQGKPPAMFPPMQLLATSGRTLDDLETNSQVPHWWQSRNKIFGTIVSLVLSITVGVFSMFSPDTCLNSSAGIKLPELLL